MLILCDYPKGHGRVFPAYAEPEEVRGWGHGNREAEAYWDVLDSPNLPPPITLESVLKAVEIQRSVAQKIHDLFGPNNCASHDLAAEEIVRMLKEQLTRIFAPVEAAKPHTSMMATLPDRLRWMAEREEGSYQRSILRQAADALGAKDA